MPDVYEIVEKSLRAGGYSGLANADMECGCFVGDLAPCGAISGYCRAVVKPVVDGVVVCVAAVDRCNT
jgi:hypothetical protein